MKNHDFIVERRMCAYITLLAGNLETTREFILENQDKLPFSSQFLIDFVSRLESLNLKCGYAGSGLLSILSQINEELEVFDETH